MQKQNTHSTYRKELKSRILHTSMQEFKQKGIRSVRMDDIANSLGTSLSAHFMRFMLTRKSCCLQELSKKKR